MPIVPSPTDKPMITVLFVESEEAAVVDGELVADFEVLGLGGFGVFEVLVGLGVELATNCSAVNIFQSTTSFVKSNK
jgi:hypothetical protein